ncbi:hypothetical protein NG798_26725 [Ancylothrix sp. C2]|uniref:hypothetical protein n=1 Tax=Ancylothrix sp. D3o TaxID=2953691 RepID=UPI0021BAD79F|nr:hypothetical protein [Ancylothrix sp. D3o]MCT7953399.1 hypothetical protein [Ancylothrix sp. D3o]
MSNDALERLKNRKRPVVPDRDSSLLPLTPDIEVSQHIDTHKSTKPTEPKKQESLPSGEAGLKTKQSTLRLEAQLSERLSQITHANNLSREVLIEAMFEYYETDGEAWQKILAVAKKKADIRIEIANQKRAKSMMQRYLDSSLTPDI